jgi:hypothetical protein
VGESDRRWLAHAWSARPRDRVQAKRRGKAKQSSAQPEWQGMGSRLPTLAHLSVRTGARGRVRVVMTLQVFLFGDGCWIGRCRCSI